MNPGIAGVLLLKKRDYYKHCHQTAQKCQVAVASLLRLVEEFMPKIERFIR